jgi:hypothetical protein
VDAARCRTFFAGCSACLCLVFCKMLVGASRLVAGAFHTLARTSYGSV